MMKNWNHADIDGLENCFTEKALRRNNRRNNKFWLLPTFSAIFEFQVVKTILTLSYCNEILHGEQINNCEQMSKSTIVNRFGLNILHRKFTHLAVIRCNTIMKLEKLKGGGGGGRSG